MLYLAQILYLLPLESSNGENFFIFKADEESVPGSMLIEDNAENEEIIILRRVVPCKLRVFELFKIIKNNRRVPGFI